MQKFRLEIEITVGKNADYVANEGWPSVEEIEYQVEERIEELLGYGTSGRVISCKQTEGEVGELEPL